MNNIETVSSRIFMEFGSTGKSVLVHSEGNVLVVRVGNSETRIFNWQTTPIESILESTRSLTIKENYKGNVILHG